MTTIEDRYYAPPEGVNMPLTDTCVCEVDRLGYIVECGFQLPDDADHDELFCGYHQGAVDRGDITWDELADYRRRYGVT